MSILRLVLLAGLLAANIAFAAEKKAPSAKPIAAAADKADRATEAKAAGYLVEPPPAWIEPAVEAPGHPVDRASMHYRIIDDQIRVDGRT